MQRERDVNTVGDQHVAYPAAVLAQLLLLPLANNLDSGAIMGVLPTWPLLTFLVIVMVKGGQWSLWNWDEEWNDAECYMNNLHLLTDEGANRRVPKQRQRGPLTRTEVRKLNQEVWPPMGALSDYYTIRHYLNHDAYLTKKGDQRLRRTSTKPSWTKPYLHKHHVSKRMPERRRKRDHRRPEKKRMTGRTGANGGNTYAALDGNTHNVDGNTLDDYLTRTQPQMRHRNKAGGGRPTTPTRPSGAGESGERMTVLNKNKAVSGWRWWAYPRDRAGDAWFEVQLRDWREERREREEQQQGWVPPTEDNTDTYDQPYNLELHAWNPGLGAQGLQHDGGDHAEHRDDAGYIDTDNQPYNPELHAWNPGPVAHGLQQDGGGHAERGDDAGYIDTDDQPYNPELHAWNPGPGGPELQHDGEGHAQHRDADWPHNPPEHAWNLGPRQREDNANDQADTPHQDPSTAWGSEQAQGEAGEHAQNDENGVQDEENEVQNVGTNDEDAETKQRAWEAYLAQRGQRHSEGGPQQEMPPWFGVAKQAVETEPQDINPPGYPPTARRRVRYMTQEAMDELRARPYRLRWQNERRRYTGSLGTERTKGVRLGASPGLVHRSNTQTPHGQVPGSGSSSSSTAGTQPQWHGWSSWSSWTTGERSGSKHSGGQGPIRQERKARQWADWQQWEQAWHSEWSKQVRHSSGLPMEGAAEEWADLLNRHRHRPTTPQGETEGATDGEEANVQQGANHEAPSSEHALSAGEPDGTPELQQQEQCHESEEQQDLVEEAEDIIDTLLDNLHSHAAGRREDEKDSSTLLQHMVDLQHGKHKDTAREAGLYVNHHVANATQQGDEVAWVQGRKRKRSDRDPENHTDHGDGEDEVKMEDKREGSRGPPSNAAVNANREGASDVDLEEQRRFENETEEERALQEEFEQDRALHEEWVQKTIDDYFADAEEEQPGPSRQRPGRQQEEGAKHHADAITMAFGRWSLGTAAGGGFEIEEDSIREVLTHILNLHPLMAEDGEAPTPHLTLLYQILTTWANTRTVLTQTDTETVERIWLGYLEGLRTAMGVNLAATAAPSGRRTNEENQLRTVNLTGERDSFESEDHNELGDQDVEPDDDAEQKHDEDQNEKEDHTTDEEVMEREEEEQPLGPVEHLGRHSVWTTPPGGPTQATRPRRGARPWPNCLLRPGHRPLKQGETLDYGSFVREATEWRRLAALREERKAAVEATPTSTSSSSGLPSAYYVKPEDQQPGGPLQGGQVENQHTGEATLTSTPTSSSLPAGLGMAGNLLTGGQCQGVPNTQMDEPLADEDGAEAFLGGQTEGDPC
ncbi:unnamed protein product [Symbiodinium natans]|uniref:Uncharacterized protein n=1 Tax=Symbiodinium natans TaxID=878477 RepID=A0A812TUN1_9DINO|nr:unnamed protein product [Symbiodinium natans]